MIATARGAYLFGWDFDELVSLRASRWSSARAWRYRRKFTAMMEGSGASSFVYRRTWEEEERLRMFIDACERAGYRDAMPGSYAWPWTERVFPPRTNPTTLVRLRRREFDWGRYPTQPKAWQEAVKPGEHKGRHYVYDLNSAYAWAAYQPMPDVRAPVYTRSVTSRPFGVYLLRSVVWTAPIVPRRLRQDRAHWVTKEELEAYGATRVVVDVGMEWDCAVDLREQIDAIRQDFPECIYKKVLRAFWGGWNSTTPVRQFIVGKNDIREAKPLTPRHYCPVWAWHVLSRVSIRCAQLAGSDALHVFTDAVMIPREAQTGRDLGDWKLAYTLDDPWVASAGVWGEGERCIKHAGSKDERGWNERRKETAERDVEHRSGQGSVRGAGLELLPSGRPETDEREGPLAAADSTEGFGSRESEEIGENFAPF